MYLTWQSNNLEALTTVSYTYTVNMVLLCLHVQNHIKDQVIGDMFRILFS